MTKVKKNTTQGKCNLCQKVFEKNIITSHLKNHLKDQNNNFSSFHLVVQDRYTPYYWLHLQVPTNFTLKKLDDYLRDIWLECCGHLSVFKIRSDEYFSDPDPDYSDQDMEITLDKVLGIGKSFEYEYDFGTTSRLILCGYMG